MPVYIPYQEDDSGNRERQYIHFSKLFAIGTWKYELESPESFMDKRSAHVIREGTMARDGWRGDKTYLHGVLVAIQFKRESELDEVKYSFDEIVRTPGTLATRRTHIIQKE
ncbi:hypothetical protein Syun_000666 [Stephania yunnanensis]|uniref:Uncharacterized protein n=1 Tax=Stephania yunnanensis TaxID=152371 RepID=A0AAP0LCN2_9MAGN